MTSSVDEQPLDGDRSAVPEGLWVLDERYLPHLPTPLVLGKAARIIAQLQEGQTQVDVRLRIVGG